GTHGGSTASTRWAARSVIRRPPQLGHQARPYTKTAPGAHARNLRTESAPRPPRTRRTAGTPETRARRTGAGRHRRPLPPPRAGISPDARRSPDAAPCARRLAVDTRAPYTPCPDVARPSRRAHAQRSIRPLIRIRCPVHSLVGRLPVGRAS